MLLKTTVGILVKQFSLCHSLLVDRVVYLKPFILVWFG